jgi:hypothetical protein
MVEFFAHAAFSVADFFLKLFNFGLVGPFSVDILPCIEIVALNIQLFILNFKY